MADHGIIIDVGFQPQIKEFINEIQNEFKKINYDEVIGLSDSFDKQKKEVEKKLKNLSQQIEETLNGKIGSEPLQQIKELQKTVDVLCGGFKELIKTLPKDQTQKLAANLGNISEQANEMNSTLTETISSIKEIAKVSDKVEIAPLNKKRIDELAESYRALAKAQQLSQSAYLPKKHGNKSYENEELAQKDFNALLKQYNSINKEITELDKESSDYVSKLDNLRAKLVTTLTELSRLSITLGDLGVSGDTLITPKKTLEQLQDLFEEKLEKLLSYISDRKAKIQAEYTSIGGEGSLEDTLFKKSEAKKDILKIPVSIQNGAQKKISEELNKLITSTNEKFKDTPLLLEVKLVSGVQSKNTQDILNKIRSELKQIDNKEISSALEQLLDQANRQIDNAFIININVATKKASAEIKEFIKQAKEDLGQKVSFDPELVLSKSNIDKFQKQLDNAGFTIDLSDFISGISELKTILDSDDSKLIKNLNEIKTISADIKSLFADLSSGKIKINSPIIEGGIVESVELTEEDKKRINEKLQDITIEIKDMLATDQIDDWSNHFINALTKISNEIKVLFGGQANALSDLLEDFNFSDKLMKRSGKDILERSGVIGTDHNMYGFGTYDRTNKNSYVSELANELRNIGITPSIGYHSHGALKQIAPSVNDIIGSIFDGLNAEIIQGLDEIVIFDTKGFLEANKDIDFSKFKKKLNDAENKLATEISNGIDEGLSKSEADEIFTSIFKRRLPEIFENILPKTKYKGKVEDFIQTMSLEDFRNSNPLGLDKESMNSLVQTSGMQKALDVLDQITEKIEVIKSANKDGSLNGAFNLNIDVKQVSVLTDKIQELIDLLSQLPQLFTTAFSPGNVKVAKANTLNSQLDDIRKEKEESQRELDELFKQIQSLKNPTVRKAPTMSDVANDDIIKTLQAKAGEKKEIYKFVEELKKSKDGELSKKSIKSLKEMLANDDIEEDTRQLIEQIITDKKLLQSAMMQVNSINKEQKEIHKTTKSKVKQPETNDLLQRVREQQDKVEKHNQEKTAKLIEELEAKAALIQQRINSLDQKEQELVRAINEMSDDEVVSDNQVIVNVQKENDELTEQQSLLKEINELWEQINSNRTKSGNISQSKSSGNLDRLTELGSKLRELKKLGGFANLGLSDKDKKVIGKYYNQTDAPSSPIVVEPVIDKDAFESLPKLVDELVPEKEEIEITPNINEEAFKDLPKLIDESTGLKDLDKAKNVLDYIRKVYSELGKTKSGKFTETQAGKNSLDDLGTRLYSYSKYIGKPGEIPNLRKVLGDSDLSEQNEKLILKYYQNAINRAEELNSMLVEAPKLVDDRYSQDDILKALKDYYKAVQQRHPFESVMTGMHEGDPDVEIVEAFDIGKKLRKQLKEGTISESEIEDIFEEKFQKAFNNISLMFPNIEPDEIENIFRNLIDVFGSIEKASEALHDSLYKNLDIESIVKKQVSSETLSYFLDELQLIKNAYIKDSKAYDVEDLTYINRMASSSDLLPDDLNTFKTEIQKVLPLINQAYESLTGKPKKYSDEQKEILSQLENEKLTLSEILSLWEQLNIQAEKGVALQGNSVASKTVIGDLNNVSFEELNNIPNGLFKSFDTLLHSHADGTGTFSVEDIGLVVQNWEAGVRRLLLFVDGELQSLDFTAATKDQVIKFQQEFANAFENKVAEAIHNGVENVFDNNEIFSKIKSDSITPLLSKYGFNIESHKIQSSKYNYSDKDIVFETDAVIQDNAKIIEQYEKETQVAEKAAEKNKELAKERELASDKYSDDMLVFETDAVLKDNSKLVEEYQKQDKSVEEIRNELQDALVIEERYLKICKEGSEAYNRRLENIRKIKEELSALVNFTTIGEPQSYGFTMKDSEVDGSKNQPNLVDDTADETARALEKESKAMDKVEKAAKKSTKSKKDFAKANKEDAQSADETTTSVLAEAKAMDYLSTDVIDKQSDEFKQAAKTAHDYFKELGDIVSITRTMGTYNAFNKENNSYEKKQRVSYRVVDTEGRSRTFNPQGDLIGSKDVINVTKAYDKLESVMKECYDLELKMQTEKDDAVIENKLVDARERYAKAEEEVNNLRDKGLSIAERELKINEQALAYNEALVQNTQKYYDNRSKRPLTALNKTVVRAEDTVNSELVNNNNGFKDNLRDLIKEAKNVNQHDIDRINELNDAINRLLRSDDAKAAKEGIVTKLMGLREQIARTVTSNTKMGSELRGQFQALAKTADDMANHIIDFSPADVQKVIQQYKELNTVMISTGQSGDSIWKRIGNRLTDMNSKLIAYYLSWQDLIRYVRTAITTIRELDTALVDLRKTTTMSTDELREFYYSANETAQQMGVTTAEIINQAAAWSRLGYSSKEAATEMSALSSQFAQISPGMSVETATDGLVSTMKAFDFEVEDVERNIMDNINRIGNTMATNNEEIVQMLERSSAAMAAANNTIEETIALESAAVQVTRNAETTGTAFRTISMRIRGYDEETEEQLEDYEELKGKIADLTKTTKTPGGISLFSDKDKTTFKSTYQLLKDISEIWDELTDKEQAQLTEKLAGKRGGQVLSSIMNDFSEVERAMTEMSNAAGSSDQEMEIIKDSIDYKLNALKESWVGFLQDALSREDTKELFDALIDGSKSLQESLTAITPILTKFVEALSWLIETVAKLNSSTGGLAGLAGLLYGGYKVKGKVNDVRNVMGGLLGSDGENKKSFLSGLSIDKIKEFLSKPAFGEVVEATEEITTSAATAAVEVDEMFDVMSAAQGAATYSEAMGEVAAAETAAGAAAGTATISMGALLGILAIAAVVIGGGIIAFNHFNVTVKEVKEEISEVESKISDLTSKIKELESIENRTNAQQDRLNLLKRELDIQNQILESKKKLLLLEQTGTKSTDRFDMDNYNTRAAVETGHLVKDNSGWSNFWGYFFNGFKDSYYETAEDVLEDINTDTYDYNRIKSEFEAIDQEISSDAFRHYDESQKNQLLKSRERHLEMLQEAEEALSNSTIIAESKAAELESVLLQMEEDGISKNTEAYKTIEEMVKKLKESTNIGKKDIGTYDFFETEDFYDAIYNDSNALEELINSEEDDYELKKKIEMNYPDLLDLMNKEGITIETLIQKYKDLSEEKKNSFDIDEGYSKSQMINNITDLSDGFDKLDEIYADVFDKGGFDFTKLSTKKFEEAFKGLEDEYTEFIETISANPNDLNASQEAFNKLVGAYIKKSDILKGLNKDNKELTANMLKNMGVANAEALVEEALADKEMEREFSEKLLAKSSKDVTEANLEEIDSLIKEGKYTDEAKNKIYAYALEKRFASGINIRNNDDLDFLTQMAYLAGVASEAIEGLEKARAAYAGIKDRVNHSITYSDGSSIAIEYDKDSFRQGVEKESQKVLDQIKEKLNATYTPEVKYTGADKTKSAIDKANKSAEESREIIDWIEKALQRQEEEIARIDKVVNATYKNWSSRNNALLNEINEINKEISMQMQAYQAYMRDAEAVPLAESYKKLVREGAMFAETITDKTLKKHIDEYTELYDKAIKAKDAIEDLRAKIAALVKMKFDNLKAEFEGFTSEIEHFINMIDKELSHVENMGKIAGKSFYKAKMDQDEQRLAELNKERAALLQALREAEANGIEEGSADWIAMRNEIYSVDEAIADLTYELEELKKKMREVAKLNFDDLKSQFENAIGILQNQMDLTDAVISMTQNAGYIASREYYESLIEGSKAKVTSLRKEYERLSDELSKAMAAGDIEQYSEEWYAMQGDIANVKKELVEAANATIEYANALRQIEWDVFDRGLDRISKMIDEAEFFQELMSWDDKLKDKETGEWTTKGIVKQGLMVQNYQEYMDKANAYGAEAEEIRQLLETDPKNTILIDRYHELLGLQRDSILAALKEKKAIADLIKEGYDELLERIKKLIDEYKDALDAAKDLMDYSNNINDKTKKISDLQKQITAYSGDAGSEETRATLQKLNAELAQAQKDLEQTEYEKYIEDQKSLLDDFYSDLEDYFDGKFQEIETLFDEAVVNVNENGALIDQTLHEEADAVNYRMTDEFANIWDKYAAEDGLAAATLDILTLTNEVDNSIRVKMDELPTEARLEEFFNGDDLRLLQQLTSVNSNTQNMITAINQTTAGINAVKSNIVEWSGVLGNKIDYAGSKIASAIASLDLGGGDGGYSAPSGGNTGGGSPTPSNPSPSNPPAAKRFRVLDEYGNVYRSGIDSDVHAAQIASAYKSERIQQLKKALGNGMPSSEYNRLMSMLNNIKVQAYKRGGLIADNHNFLDYIAQLFGEDHMVAAKEGERILTEEQNKNFEKMVNANFTPLDSSLKDKYSMLSSTNGVDISSIMANIPTPQVGNVANVGNTTTVGDINITLPNVTNKEEFVQWLKTDGQVEKIVQSMTVGRMMGGNSFAKMKY